MIPGNTPQEFFGAAAAAGGAEPGLSVRFNSADSAYLSRTPASAGNRKTYTLALWCKRSALSASNFYNLFGASGDGYNSNWSTIAFGADCLRVEDYVSNASATFLESTAVFRDVSAWYHIVVAVDTTQATASNRYKLYVNGSQITVFNTASYPAQNTSLTVNNTVAHQIGGSGNSSPGFNGYLALVHFIDGQQLTPSSFGETSATTGRWEAKTYAGTYSGNSFFLDFLDNSAATATTLGKDSSGLGNNWTPNNIQATLPNNSVTLPASNAPSSVEYLVVGGGGGGGSSYAGGGGAGGFRTGTLSVTAGSTYSVQVGVGGTGATVANSNGTNGTDSIFSSITSIGGGGGGGAGGGTAGSGGSGGGSVAQAAGTGTSGQGNNGATGSGSGTGGGGGGGGAGAAGTAGAASVGGAGGAGSSSSITGTSVTYAGGGGGGTEGSSNGAGGSGGGGAGGTGSVKGGDGTANRGGGGGGGGGAAAPARNGGNGGSGIVVIRYANTYADLTIGGGLTYTSANTGGYKIYTITASSTDTAAGVDSLRDHPVSAGTSTGLGGEVSGNYATWNPLAVTPSYQASSLTNGNLDAYVTGNNRNAYSTIAFPSSGKYFFEVTLDGSFSGAPIVGVSTFTGISDAYPSYVTTPSVVYNWDGTKAVNGTTSSYGATFGAGAVIGVAVNIDASSVTFYKNGVSQGAISINVSGAMPHVGSAGATGTYSLNAGQRAFAYTAPSGFSPLVDTLLPTPTIAKPNTVMNVVTGNFDTTKTWTVGFNPDLIWIKSRSNADGHVITDSVRGTNAQLQSNTTGAELTNTTAVTSFNSDGFTIGTYGLVSNTSTVAWCWDAGSSNATNTSGTITSTCRTNISAGFSIVSYTGTGANASVGHSLGVAPSFMVVKNRDFSDVWMVYHSSLGATKYIILNRTDAAGTLSSVWNNTAPTSSVFSIGSLDDVNRSSNKFIAYCWAPVTNYSSFGSYTGNGSSDGPFVYTGFRPAYVLIKGSSSVTSWNIVDKQRLGYNANNYRLFAESSSAENATGILDFTANGFKIRNIGGDYNDNAQTYVYACFAESPLPYARAR